MARWPDTVFIRGLQAEAIIGVYDWEHRVRQPLELDLDLATDTRPAADSDEVDRLWELWQAAGGGSDLQGAWSTVVEGLIRHPSMVRY